MGKEICKYAIPMKPPYQFPFACAVMYECRWKDGGKNIGKSCPRFQIGENREKNGQELRGRRVVKRYDDIRKALEDRTVTVHATTGKTEQLLKSLAKIEKENVIIRKHANVGKSDELMDIIEKEMEE